jgi:Tripartite tricarboxylate transporter TctB family
VTDGRAIVSRTVMEVATALATALVGAAVIWGAAEHDVGWGDSGPASGYFPFRIGILIVLASLANLISAFRRRGVEPSAFVTDVQIHSVLAFGLPVVAFVLISSFLGLYVGTVLYLVFVMTYQGGYRLIHSVALALAVVVAMRLIFPIWFKVPLLTGPLEGLLGIY